MLTLKASVAAAILVGAIAATAGVTYLVTKTTVSGELSRPNGGEPAPDETAAFRSAPHFQYTKERSSDALTPTCIWSGLLSCSAGRQSPFPPMRSPPAVLDQIVTQFQNADPPAGKTTLRSFALNTFGILAAYRTRLGRHSASPFAAPISASGSPNSSIKSCSLGSSLHCSRIR